MPGPIIVFLSSAESTSLKIAPVTFTAIPYQTPIPGLQVSIDFFHTFCSSYNDSNITAVDTFRSTKKDIEPYYEVLTLLPRLIVNVTPPTSRDGCF